MGRFQENFAPFGCTSCFPADSLKETIELKMINFFTYLLTNFHNRLKRMRFLCFMVVELHVLLPLFEPSSYSIGERVLGLFEMMLVIVHLRLLAFVNLLDENKERRRVNPLMLA